MLIGATSSLSTAVMSALTVRGHVILAPTLPQVGWDVVIANRSPFRCALLTSNSLLINAIDSCPYAPTMSPDNTAVGKR